MAGETYSQRYAGGFVDGDNSRQVDDTFLNAVEAALMRLLGEDPGADELGVWTPGSGRFVFQKITNTHIDPAAAIAKSKLAALAIVDADVAPGAAIAKSKLAALNLVNADIAAAAAIAVSKLASGGPYQPLTGDASGAPTWGGLPLVTSLPGSPVTGTQVIFTDSLTAPTYVWPLVYQGGISDANKWVAIGPSPLEGTTTVTVPRAGNYYVEIGAMGDTYDGTTNDTLALTAGGITLQAFQGNNGGGTQSGRYSSFDRGRMTGLTASQVLTPTVGGSPTRQYIRITPVRIA